MLDFIHIIFFLGMFNLLKLVWSDTENLTVDQRPSWLMNGVVLTCFYLSGRVLEFVAIAFIVLIALSYIKKYSDKIGLASGDITILAWVLSGMLLLGYYYLLSFFIAYTIVLFLIYKLLHKNSGIPATIPIAIGFVTVFALQTLGILV